MPAWQKRQPSVQPRAISTAMRSKTASAYGTGESSGNGKRLMSRDQRAATARRHARIERRADHQRARCAASIVGRVERGHVERTARGQADQALAARHAARAAAPPPSAAATGSTSSASPMKNGVDERRQRLGVRGRRAAGRAPAGRVVAAVGRAQRDAAEVEQRQHVGVGQLVLQRDADHVELARAGAALSSVTSGSPRARSSRLHVEPRRERALARDAAGRLLSSE